MLSKSNSNLTSLAQQINGVIKFNLLEIQDDSIRINMDHLRRILGNTVEFSITKWFQNQSLAVTLRPTIDDFFEFYSADLETWINKISRKRRQKRDTVLQITTKDSFLDDIGYEVGCLVESLGTAIGSLIQGVTDGSLATIISSIISIIAVILQPIMLLLGDFLTIIGNLLSFIYCTFGFILSPLNYAIKLYIFKPIVKNLECDLGHTVLSPIRNLLNQLINTFIPCDTCTNL